MVLGDGRALGGASCAGRPAQMTLRFLALLVAVLAVVGCGDASSSAPTPQPLPSAPAVTPDPALTSLLPAQVLASRELRIGTDATYMPDEFVAGDGVTISGWDMQLATAVAAVLGLHPHLVNTTIDTIVADVANGRYDIAVSSIVDTKDRERSVDFVTYFNAGSSFFTRAHGGAHIVSLADLCGHRVAVDSGTSQEVDAQTQAQTCKTQSRAPLTVDVHADQASADAALAAGSDDVDMADSPIAAYEVHQSKGAFVLTGMPYGVMPYGMATAHGGGLTQAVLAALKDLIASGVYTRILAAWGEQGGAVTTPSVDGATS